MINWLVVLILTLISGWGDSRGFLYADKIWVRANMVPSELLKSGLGFAVGITSYWIALKYLKNEITIPPEIQTIGWFAITMIGLAISSGKFTSWNRIDQAIGLAVVIGIGWLMIRTGA